MHPQTRPYSSYRELEKMTLLLFRQQMKDAKVTQDEIASRLGCSRVNVSYLLRGDQRLTLATYLLLSDLLGSHPESTMLEALGEEAARWSPSPLEETPAPEASPKKPRRKPSGAKRTRKPRAAKGGAAQVEEK